MYSKMLLFLLRFLQLVGSAGMPAFVARDARGVEDECRGVE